MASGCPNLLFYKIYDIIKCKEKKGENYEQEEKEE
jgi:hypothetical protein